MPKAIRIDGSEVLNAEKGEWHYEVMCRYQEREGLTDEELDKMIDDGRLDFGSTFLNRDSKLEFSSDKSRNAVYTSVNEVSKLKRKW